MNRTSSSEEALRERIAQTWDSPIYCSHSSAFQQQKEDSTRRRLWYKVFGLNPPPEAEMQEVLKMMQVFYKQNRNINNDWGVSLTNHGFTSRKSESFTNFLKIILIVYICSATVFQVFLIYSIIFWAHYICMFDDNSGAACNLLFFCYPTIKFFPWFST